jgi:hypothetical protein
LSATTPKCRPKPACEWIPRKRFWVKPGLLRGCTVLIECRPLLFIFQNLDGPVRAEAVTTTITDIHHMPLEFQQTCLAHSCRGSYLDDICGLAELGVKMKRHTLRTRRSPHRKVDLLDFSGGRVLADAKDLVGVFWSTWRSRCMKKPLQEHAHKIISRESRFRAVSYLAELGPGAIWQFRVPSLIEG